MFVDRGIALYLRYVPMHLSVLIGVTGFGHPISDHHPSTHPSRDVLVLSVWFFCIVRRQDICIETLEKVFT